MTTDSDSDCSYVANLADFNVIIVIVIKIIVMKIAYNSNQSDNSNYSNNSKKRNNSHISNSYNYSKNSNIINIK